MTIPPFPPEDLAKLVLGYLAEEQLMTAYDEFLQTSPYLDALRNEYKRILMTSLRTIVAEYWAVKIFVETCKPALLRKKLFQCPNLPDLVKFLINNVDLNKLQYMEAVEKASLEKHKVTKSQTCQLCQLASCVCKTRHIQGPGTNSNNCDVASTPHNSVETTLLSNLPGTYNNCRKKHVKTLEKESTILSSTNVSSGHNSDSGVKDSHSSTSVEHNTSYQSSNFRNADNTVTLNETVKPAELDSRRKIEEFNDVLKSVVKRNSTLTDVFPNENISKSKTIQDIVPEVKDIENQSATVPDSSTCESLNLQPVTKPQLLLQVSHVKDSFEIQTLRDLPMIAPKPDEQRIKILSDVKLDSDKIDTKSKKKGRNRPQPATSSPLMQMQTIVINGTPAYTNDTPNNHTYTKDEIMAMPTLIVVPASGSSKSSSSTECKTVMSQCRNRCVSTSSGPPVLGPLVIKVPDSPAIQNESTGVLNLNKQNIHPTGLVKTVDIKNASVPKDSGTTTTTATNTPQVTTLTRKSSSTPRRTSHVRVLDFTTPRRILQETINEQIETAPMSQEIVLSGTPSVSQDLTTNAATTNQTPVITYTNSVVTSLQGTNVDNGSTKENSTNKLNKSVVKQNWDADLRALAVTSDYTVSHRKPKKIPRKKKGDQALDINKSTEKKSSRKKSSPKVKKPRRIRRKIEDDEEDIQPDVNKKAEIPVKPNINIISVSEQINVDIITKTNNHSIQNKSNEKADDIGDTPEGDRLSLQNVIGAKLNISELLETPYKQALYDIQMETPRLLGPDLPDEPMSDFKIMNIPTPRFLNTPKPAQATPSYASRATDYSSGSSYYKPDDQDYIVIPDVICPVTSTKQSETIENDDKEQDSDNSKKSRPVRQCTKNVSYYKNSVGTTKTKYLNENVDCASTSSESTCTNSVEDFKNEKENITKTSKQKSKPLSSDSNKRGRPRLTAVKEKTKPFIKIKPRQTPTKVTPSGKGRRKTFDTYNSPNRKMTTSKDKATVTPLVNCVPTKSRRKSSTPRKLHCAKTFNSATFARNQSEDVKHNTPQDSANPTDSDTEQLALRWSDDGSQDGKVKEQLKNASGNDGDDICKIQEYIQNSKSIQAIGSNQSNVSLQADLIKRGFDVETAKIIERDLLDTPPHPELPTSSGQISVKITDSELESPKEKTLDTDTSGMTNELHIVQDDEIDDIELSVHECNEDSQNYFSFEYDETKETHQGPPITLKDKFSMEVCIDEEITLRLRASQYLLLYNQDPISDENVDIDNKETELAVSSISNMERLYTPLKDCIKAQCYEIFDSTLTSLDTPLKAVSPKRREVHSKVTEIVIEEEKNESMKEKTDTKKRKRLQSAPDDSVVDSKKAKHDTQYLLKSTNIQNIDIESVLTKLHGP